MKEWTAIFLIYADLKTKNPEGDPIEASVNKVLKEISECNLNEKINIVRIYNRVNIEHKNRSVEDITEMHELYINTKGLNDWKPIGLPRSSSNLFQKKGDLIKYLIEIKGSYPSKKYSLFTWDHGSAFGIFKESMFIGDFDFRDRKVIKRSIDDEQAYIIVKNDTRYLKYYNNLNNRAFAKSLSKTGDMLTNEELADIIKEGLGKVDILIMMNCYMHNLHLCNDIHTRVDFLIAPQGNIFDNIYNYTALLNEMAADIDAAPLCVKIMKQIATNISSHKMRHELAVFCSEIKLTYSIVTLLIGIIAHLQNLINTPSNKKTIKQNVLLPCYEFEALGYHLTDITHVMRALKYFYPNDNLILSSLNNLEQFVKAAIKEPASATFVPPKGYLKYEPLGYSLYLAKDYRFTKEPSYSFIEAESKRENSLSFLINLDSFLKSIFDVK